MMQWLGALQDSLVNLVSGLGTSKDAKVANTLQFRELNRKELEDAYRSDWVARAIVDCPADDATREWRDWQANQDQIELLEEVEKNFLIQRKMRLALVRARLYGGACLAIGVDDGNGPEEPLDLDKVKKGSLKFIQVFNRYEMSAGPRIYDVGSPWYTRPEYYSVSTPVFGWQADETSPVKNNDPLAITSQGKGDRMRQLQGLIHVHPSRIIEFCGNELPDWRLAPMGGGWGDSILQTVNDALMNWAMTASGVASMINDAKVDIINVPGLSEKASNEAYRAKLIARFSVANLAKSVTNSILLDEKEVWQRIRTNFGDIPELIREMLVVVSGAGRIPVSRLMGQAPGRGLSTQTSGGEQDVYNYYDTVTAQQKADYTPRLIPLDEVLIRTALGTRDPAVHYEWTPLYRPDPKDLAQIALQKAQAFQIDVTSGIINTDALREGRINQLIEDGTYPGFQDAVDENNDGKPEEPPPGQGPIDPKTGLPLPALPGAPQRPMLPPPGGGSRPPQKAGPGGNGGRPGAKPSGGQQIKRQPPGLHISIKTRDEDAGFVDYNPNHDELGRFTGGSGIGGASYALAEQTGRGWLTNYGLRKGDAARYEQLKSRWSQINNSLLSQMDTPDSDEARAKLGQLESIVKEMHSLRVDPGTPEGTGLPGGPRDVTIVGAGPGGLTAGINGGAEGLDTLIVEANATPGGQAKFSSRVENFPGFPVGVPGERLTQNMFKQAKRVGADTKLGVRVTGLQYDPQTGLKHLTLSNGEAIDTRSVILAGGVEFQRMEFPGSDGPGVIIGDGRELTKQATGGNAVVVGGSNGAAQAALGAATKAEHVYVMSRSPVSKAMSAYQVEALRHHPKVTVIEGDTIGRLHRDAKGNPTSLETTSGRMIPTKALGLFLGSVPKTDWLANTHIQRDKQGKIQADANFETAIPGVFAIGDMRSGSIGRIGVAAGEGQLALRQSYQYLDELKKRQTRDSYDGAPGDARNFISQLFALDREHPYFGQIVEQPADDMPDLLDYSPDQPRDPRGRFTSGGAGGLASTARSAGRVAARVKNHLKNLLLSETGGVNTEIATVAGRELMHSLGQGTIKHVAGTAGHELYEHVREFATHTLTHALVEGAAGVAAAGLGALVGHAVLGAVAGYAVHRVAHKLGFTPENAAKAISRVGHYVLDHWHELHERALEPVYTGDADALDDEARDALAKFIEAIDDWSADGDGTFDFNPNHDESGRFTSGASASGAGDVVSAEAKLAHVEGLAALGAAVHGLLHPHHEQGYAFVSPNVESARDFNSAREALSSPEHGRAAAAWADVDRQLGLKSEDHGVIGAWSDGAENAVMSTVQDASWDQIRTSAAMKGSLGNQKAVLAFHEEPGGSAHLFSFDARGDLGQIHRGLLQEGIEFHSIEPHSGGARVHVVDLDGSMLHPVESAATRHGSEIDVHEGRAEFIGTTRTEGTDQEQRADARRAYESVISQSKVPNAQAIWKGLHYRRAATALGDPGTESERADTRRTYERAVRPVLPPLGQSASIHGLIGDYDPDEPRDDRGRWTAGGSSGGSAGGSEAKGGGGEHPGHGYSKEATVDDKGVIHTTNVDDAVRALYENKKVELNQPREVATLLDRLSTVAQKMQEMGAEAKNFDLCNVSVKGTNLFCAESKGIPRIKMPQIPEDKNEAFQSWLEDHGHKVETTTEKADHLRATQNELVGAKVAGIAHAMEKSSGKGALDQPIFISREGYVVDGHHRWAAKVGVDSRNNELGDITMPVRRVDMPIIELLQAADEFTGGAGHVGTDVSQQKR